VLREDVKADADEKKNGELKQNDYAAGQQSAAAVFFIFCGEKALDDGLIGAVAGHGEECAADEAGPERIFCREVPGKIEDLQFVACGCGDLRNFGPSAGEMRWKRTQKVTALPVI